MLDYLETLVLAEVKSILSQLPHCWTLGHAPSLFSSVNFFPLNSLFNNCISDDIYKIFDSCTSSNLPKTFETSSFTRRYTTLLANTLVTTTSNYTGDNSTLANAAKAISLCTLAIRNASANNGGLCHYLHNNKNAAKQYVPGYEVKWLPEQLITQGNITINVNVWRESADQPWQHLSSYKGVGERLAGTLVYSQLKIAIVNPTQYNSTTQKGWYDPHLLNGIRNGIIDNLQYSAVSANVFSSIELQRARLYFLVGKVKFIIEKSTQSSQAASFQKMKVNNTIQLTAHLKIPQKLKTTLNNKFMVKKLASKGKAADFSAEVTSQWDSGDLYKDINAGLIVAIIEDTPLKLTS